LFLAYIKRQETMKFGKLDDISHTDFTLPPDHPDTAVTLKQYRSTQKKPEIYIGSARWGERSLVGKIYPPGTAAKDYLYHYSRQFATIELNMTHYRIPTVAMVEQWRKQSLSTFKFCPKIPQSISHRKDFGASLGATEDFLQALHALGDQLGIPFMQLPPNFKPEIGKSLFNYLETWPQDVPLAVEFRHWDWFTDKRIEKRAFDLLGQMHISPVITDTAGRRDVIHQRLTTETVFIRFVGNLLHPTDYSRIDDWVNRLTAWFEAGLHRVFFIVHQPEENLCVDLAVYLANQLNDKLRIKVTAPKPLQVGEQQRLFD
jgi:uncharacterized protein YecE (DUF72 family)